MPRKKLIAANWKMYKTPRDFFREFLPLIQGHERDEIVVCPTYLALDAAIHAAKGTKVAVGAQDLHREKEGVFTGEVNAAMLVAVGVTHVIIGHSERRQFFGETDDTVNLKLKSALEAGLVPIVCVGEVLEEGSSLRLRKLEEDYDPTDKIKAVQRLMESHAKGEVLTGVFYINAKAPSFIDLLNITDRPLATLPESAVRPSREALDAIMEELR